MFEWLVDVISPIKTRKFFLVDGPASAELREAVAACDFPVPPSYKEFVLQFGNSKLYRYSSGYYITIFASPRNSSTKDGEQYLHFGGTWTSNAFFKESLLTQGQDSPVFESYQNSFRKTADVFAHPEKYFDSTIGRAPALWCWGTLAQSPTDTSRKRHG